MLDDDPDDQLHDEMVPSIESKQALIGFTSFQKAYSLMQQTDQPWLDAADGETKREELEAAHERATEAVLDLTYDISEPEIRRLPDDPEMREHVDRFAETAGFRRILGDVPDDEWEIGLVPVNKLVAYQGTVTTTAHEEIPSWEETPLDVLEYTLPIERFQAHFHRTFKNDRSLGIEFTNRSPNVELSGLQVANGETPMEKRVVIGLRAKPNFVWIVRYNDRLILKDGYHRTYQQFADGATHVPAVIQDVDSYERTGHSGGMLTQETVMADRPPVIPDFESDAAMEVKTPATNKVITVSAEETQVVR